MGYFFYKPNTQSMTPNRIRFTQRIIRIGLPMVMMLTMASCGNQNESLLMQYEDAIKKGDFDRANELIERMDIENLTHEQSQRIINATTLPAENMEPQVEESPEALPEIPLEE